MELSESERNVAMRSAITLPKSGSSARHMRLYARLKDATKNLVQLLVGVLNTTKSTKPWHHAIFEKQWILGPQQLAAVEHIEVAPLDPPSRSACDISALVVCCADVCMFHRKA